MELDVAIAGAGPAGLACAVALRRADPSLRVHLFEKTAMTGRGAAILVGVNGLKALHAIDAGLTEDLLAKAIKLEGSERYNLQTGAWKEWLPMRNDEFKARYGFHNSLLGWSDITGALSAALPPDSITAGAAVEGVERLPGGGVRVLGPGGAPLATAGAVVGADGWFSGVRAQLLADGPPTFKDVVVWRARLPRREGWLPSESRTRWWVPPAGPSPGAQLAVLIPVPGGDMVWQAHAPVSLLQERGIAFDPVTGEASSSHAAAGGAGAAKARCLAALEGVPGLAEFRSVVDATPDASVSEHGLYQRTPEQIPDRAWGAGMVTLAGDAAHTAYVDGTGLALSLEDAAVLGLQVQRLGLCEAALRAYEAERIPRVKAVFGLAGRQAAAMAAGVPQQQLLEERAALLYGEAHFEPLGAAAAAAASPAAAGA
ncbi:MAG: hypothetical protein J3K34DRAFT_411487 [Monoraphidium minutum]|nr:MAG: hypothetical protein J3K34DRAFT_411487 [Monoraphidium minutum]